MVEERKLMEGYKKTEVGVIPEDWDVVKLKEIIDYTKGYAFKSSEYKENGVRIIRVSDTDYDSIKNSDPIYIDENDYMKYRNWSLKENDLILSTVGSKPPMYNSMVGKVVKVDALNSGSLLNQNAVKLSARNQNVSTQLLIFNNLKTKNYLTYIEKIFRGNANQASITLKELFEYQIALPKSSSEQKLIAKALDDTDNLIQSIEKLIDKKEKIKKGTMQELLTGKKRLDGFSGEWEVKRLGSMCSITTGKLDANAMVENGDYRFYTCAKEAYRINTYVFDTEALLVSGNGANVGYIHYYKGKFNAYQRTYVLTDFLEEIKYIKAFMDIRLKDRIDSEVNAGNTPYIKMDTLTDMKINIPTERAEQKAIAQIIFDMNQEMEVLKEKLEKYKTIKQGMMQELLTGRIRLI